MSSGSTKITITLGRSGQVVTKESFKRPPADRSWSYGNSSSLPSNKRHRGDGMQWSPGVAGKNGSHIPPNDLRLKLMRQRESQRSQKIVKQRRIIKKHEIPVSYRTLPSRPSSSQYSNLRPARADEFHSGFSRADSYGRTNPSQITVGSRARSPGRISRVTHELSPPRDSGQMQRMRPIRSADFSSNNSLLRSGAPSASRPLLTRYSPLTPVKPIPQAEKPLPQVPRTNATPQQVWQPKVEVPLTVASLLHSLGLGKYCINFQAEEVDLTVLKQMGEKDLKNMGIPMGPRKKILVALLPPLPKKPMLP